MCLQVPYYSRLVNIIWGGLWLGMLDVVAVLLALQMTIGKQVDPGDYTALMTKVCCIL
jgi:hypothetical protein